MATTENNLNKKVLVAMSGGIDSSASAILLQKQGYDVTGCIMQLTDNTSSIEKAQKVANFLGIQLLVLDLRTKFEKAVKNYFINEYLNARTPNPCVVCNEKIKFGLLLNKALNMGFEKVATGHYTGIEKDNLTDEFVLIKGTDSKKDQSYFLYRLNQQMLSRIIFPLSKFVKSETRELVTKYKFPNFDSEESQEICFVPNSGYVEYIKQTLNNSSEFQTMNTPGDIIKFETGKKIGSHIGLIHYTVGQSKGLRDLGKKYYVIGIDKFNNKLLVGSRKEASSNIVMASNIRIMVPKKFKIITENPSKFELSAKIRYNSKEASCNLILHGDLSDESSILEVIFEEPQFAVTKGQSIVLYDKNTVIGGGVII